MLRKETNASAEMLKRLVEYNPETGLFVWKEGDLYQFSNANAFGRWRTFYAGKEAFITNHRGYKVVQIDYVGYQAHRVAWMFYHGRWPTTFIDHINGNKSDNRIVNLREVSHSVNCRNRPIRKDNSSGFSGVWKINIRGSQKWCAIIRTEGKRYNLGNFETPELAASAIRGKQVTLGFHENHGRKS